MIVLTERGLYCEAGQFYIDPCRAVDVALITHAHSDHARRGSRKYVCAESSTRLLARRMGEKAPIQGVPYRERLRFGEAWVSFHPAGHILGSAQIRIEHGGSVWVVSGDYKRESDPTCEPFEVVPCDTFVTEATFGSPRYAWPDGVAAEIFDWWEGNRRQGRNSVLYCYALGKAQRVLAELAEFTDREALVWGETAELTDCYRSQGVRMLPTRSLEELPAGTRVRGALIVAPHSFSRSPWAGKFSEAETAFASGWMKTGAFGMASSYDRGFVLSDHADWPGLVRTVEETGAKRVLVLHEREGRQLIRYLRGRGYLASGMGEADQGELGF
jgi:putative mRNA 3-end processing factor